MDNLLPPRDWVWDGGRPSLDLVNTLRNRKTGGLELLRDPADLAAWLAASGLVAEGRPLAPPVSAPPVPALSVSVPPVPAPPAPVPPVPAQDSTARDPEADGGRAALGEA